MMRARFLLPGFLLLAGASLFGQSVVRGPYLQSGTPAAITLRWRTDLQADSVVHYGTDPGLLGATVSVPGLRTEHGVTLNGLSPETVYWYSVGSSSTTYAGGPEFWFKTAPPVGFRRPVRAWILGDSGTANFHAARVRDAYLAFNGSRHTDLWLMLGDNAYVTGTDAEYQVAVFDMYPGMLRRSVLWPTLGNHDALSTTTTPAGTGPYYEIFDLPAAGEAGGLPSGVEGYYAFDHANIHFICLNSSQGDAAYFMAMASWLQADLMATAQEWVIAFWHHPPYSKGSHDSDAEVYLTVLRQILLPILEAAGVDLVLTGHSHSFERSMLIDGHYGLSSTFQPVTMAVDPGNGQILGTGAYRKPTTGSAPHEGAVYIVAGSSGQTEGGRFGHPVMIRSLNELGSCVLDAWGNQIDVRFLDDTGAVCDSFTMVKGGVTPVRRETRRLVGLGCGARPIEFRSVWKFNDLGVDLGTAWTAAGFDDFIWARGPAPLGFGDPGIVTTVSFGGNPSNVHPTTYFRHTFTLGPDPQALSGIRFSVDYDDGFVAYLNGTEVARSANTPAGPVGFQTLAMAPHGHGTIESFDLMPFVGLLLPGNNVLAIEVHQDVASSSDLWLDARLELFTVEQIWRHEDSGLDLGTAWRLPAFDDSTWAMGPAPLGYGEIWLSTPVNSGPAGTPHPTAYFRKGFDLPVALGLIERLRLFVDHDDGFVAWLNGAEVARSASMPPGPVSFTTPTSYPREAGSPEVFDIMVHAGLLVPAGNVLAIEVHQSVTPGADLVLDATLEYDLAPIPYLGSCAAGAVVDAVGEPESLLFVNASDGGLGRSVDIRANSPIELRLEVPTQGTGSPIFAVAIRPGTPGPGEALVLSGGAGAFCFHPLASTILLASNLPGAPGLIPASSLPLTYTHWAGLPVLSELTLQGIVSIAPGTFRTTNAVRVRIVP